MLRGSYFWRWPSRVRSCQGRMLPATRARPTFAWRATRDTSSLEQRTLKMVTTVMMMIWMVYLFILALGWDVNTARWL